MKIQLNTDKNIAGTEALANQVNTIVEHALERFRDQITRIEVHLRDESGDKITPADKRCNLEARLEGHQPLMVSDHGDTVEQAIKGAAGKLYRLIESTLGRLSI